MIQLMIYFIFECIEEYACHRRLISYGNILVFHFLLIFLFYCDCKVELISLMCSHADYLTTDK